MESFLQKVFGLSFRSSQYLERNCQKDTKKKRQRNCGTSVDRRPTPSTASNTANSTLCYRLDNKDVELQTKRVKKYNKHKMFRISNRQEKGKDDRKSHRLMHETPKKPALLLIKRHQPHFFLASDFDPYSKTFDKYIPIENFDTPAYKLSDLDRNFPLCWFDVQTWYRETRARQLEKDKASNRRSVRTSLSDTTVYKSDSACKIETKANKDLIESTKSISQLSEDKRLGLDINETYCQVTTEKSPGYVIELWVELPKNKDLSLCHLKTEMVVHCLQKFFFPVADIHVMWVKNLKGHALRLCSVRGLQRHLPESPRNTPENTADYLDKTFQGMQALMVVSEDAAVLLKHGELCFLDTLAVISEVSPEHIVVYKQIRKSKQLAVIHELS